MWDGGGAKRRLSVLLLESGGSGARLAMAARTGVSARLSIPADVSFVRRKPSEAERTARYAGGIAMGVANEAAPGGGRGPGELDDITLTREVETEIFRPPAAPKAR